MLARVSNFDPLSVDGWASRIADRWHDSVQAIFDVGNLIAEAKAALPQGDFLTLSRKMLPFSARTAQRFMAIAADERLSDATRVSLLPAHWGTLYEITRLDDAQLERRFTDGTICPDMDRKDISTAVKQTVRATRESMLGHKLLAAPKVKAGCIVEDFEWDHVTWSDKGRDRAAENHYIVARDAHTAAEVVERTRVRMECAADNCVIWSWTTVQHLAIALDVMRMRDFDYRSHYIWGKDSISLGYWGRNKHEVLLIGVKGEIMCPAPGTQWDSLVMAPKGEHSAKPEDFLKMIEGYFPTLPKIELNRRGPPREGWFSWGNEAESGEASA